MRTYWVAVATYLAVVGVASAQSVTSGAYLCTVERLAGVGSLHLEGAGAPRSFTNDELYRFRLMVTATEGGRLLVRETPYDGPDPSLAQWEDENSTLHSAYLGDGRAFQAEDSAGFLNFGSDRWGSGLQFYHSGFQYAGGEDESVAVRWGRCSRQP